MAEGSSWAKYVVVGILAIIAIVVVLHLAGIIDLSKLQLGGRGPVAAAAPPAAGGIGAGMVALIILIIAIVILLPTIVLLRRRRARAEAARAEREAEAARRRRPEEEEEAPPEREEVPEGGITKHIAPIPPSAAGEVPAGTAHLEILPTGFIIFDERNNAKATYKFSNRTGTALKNCILEADTERGGALRLGQYKFTIGGLENGYRASGDISLRAEGTLPPGEYKIKFKVRYD